MREVKYFFLSMSGASDFGAFSTITGILSGYFDLILSATSFLLAKMVNKYPI